MLKSTQRTSTLAPLLATLMLGSTAASAITVDVETDAALLAERIAGVGISVVGTPTLTGAFGQAATYTGAAGPADGVVFSTGNAADIPGTPSDVLNTSFGGPGDADIAALPGLPGAVPGGLGAADAVVLEFDFIAAGPDASLSLFLATDDLANGGQAGAGPQTHDITQVLAHGFNDAALVSINGTPLIFDANGTAIGSLLIQAIAAGGPGGTNPLGTAPISDTGFGEHSGDLAQGFTLGSGVHTIKIAIADGTDGGFDTALFLPNGSLTAVPTPTTAALLMPAAMMLLRRRR